jgi:2-polyprenyl-6-methoxyphenol hydroxylase-like FAD-dependent oxidoreductase
MPSILIAGASVAGPTLAYWLHQAGFQPTIVERAPAPRSGGQAIDIRGAALTVVERMGLLDQVRQLRTRLRGMSVLDADGHERSRSTTHTLTSGRLDSDDVELMREDLTNLLYARTRDAVQYRFGDSIRALEEDGRGVRVEFERSTPGHFDLVVGADGLHSTVRRLAFGPEAAFVHHLGTYLATFSAPNFLALDDWQLWVQAPTAGGVIYPARGNSELRVTLGFGSEPLAYDYHDLEQQKRFVEEHLADMGWEIPRLLQAMHGAPDFYFDAMAQVRMPGWSKGRATLVGDAGYCASPLSGQGTSLALVGAYVLADALARNGSDAPAALASYERRLRGFVELNQALVAEHADGEPAEDAIVRASRAIELAA